MKFLAITLIVHAPDPVTGGGFTERQHRDSLELFQSDIAPTLRRTIADPPWSWGPVLGEPQPVTV